MLPAHLDAPPTHTLSGLALGLLTALQPAAAQSADAASLQRVEIRSDADAKRRADVAGRHVVGRDELLRHGDVRLVDALQRVPGVSVETRGSSTEIKLSGLGAGYTQILLNGEPLPRGVTLDSIALDSIERVEIVRGATVQSSQAIAGSINLVTRRVATVATRDTRLSLASQWGRPQMSAALNLGGSAGRSTWGLGTVISRENRLWPATFVQERRDGVAQTLSQRTVTHKREFDNTDAISLNPRLAWKHEDELGGSWQLSTDHSLRYARSSGGVQDRREAQLGPAPAQHSSDMALNYHRWFWRGRAQAQYRGSDGAQLEARLNVTHSSRDQQAHSRGFDFGAQQVQDTRVDGLAVDQSVVLNLNHQRPLGASHRLDLGTEWEQARRREDRLQVELALPGGLPPENLDERYDARVQRWALYLQDDWSLSDATALQIGLRLERLDTVSEGNVFDRVQQTHDLVGPVLRVSTQASKTLGTFKLGLSRGFRLPTPRDVMPRRYVPIEVSPTAPAQSGNPDLKPERAWSLDGSWHKPWAAVSGELVLSASLRRIDDVILDRLVVQPEVLTAPWLLQRFNGGGAWTAGLEVELKGQAAHGWIVGAPLRWQASLALARSRLVDVDAGRPALPGQAPWEVKLNLTQKFSQAWAGQLGLEARGADRADLPSARRIENLGHRGLSAGLTWQPRPRETWRMSVAQIGAPDGVSLKSVGTVDSSGPVSYLAREAWHREVVWRLGLDLPL
jgi:outer membrane receptor for ferrienterochelin and colicin